MSNLSLNFIIKSYIKMKISVFEVQADKDYTDIKRSWKNWLTLISCTLFGGTEPLVGMIAIGWLPAYLILNSPAFDPWLISDISLAIVLLLATTLPKSTDWSTSRIGLVGYL